MNLGHWALARDDFVTARRHYLESLAWRRQLGTRWIIAIGLREVGHVMCLENNYAQAEPVYTEALALARALGDQRNEASIARLIGAVLLEQNDEWLLRHRYMQIEGMAELTPPLIDADQATLSPMAA